MLLNQVESDVIVVIPARLAASRLPDKPLARMGGVPMIVQVWRRAMEAAVGPVLVAAGDSAIKASIEAEGGEALLTDPDLASGTDRIKAALDCFDPDKRYRRVVNLQGDLPTLDPALIRTVLRPLDALSCEMATLAAPTLDPAEIADPNVVKAVIAMPEGEARAKLGRALYFTRAAAPSGPGPVHHHIGIYAFERATLEHFAALPPTPLERRERLEQLRALEHGISIGVACVDTVPLGVDTPADLQRARDFFDQ